MLNDLMVHSEVRLEWGPLGAPFLSSRLLSPDLPDLPANQMYHTGHAWNYWELLRTALIIAFTFFTLE